MKVTIFYSWQSVLPNSTNRGFIERALTKAVESIKVEDEMVVEPCIERDVQGVPGTPDIAQTIFRKIDECRIFVGDVSIINSSATVDRKPPNPNVLIETSPTKILHSSILRKIVWAISGVPGTP